MSVLGSTKTNSGSSATQFMTPEELRYAVNGSWAIAPTLLTPTRGVGTDTRSDLSGRVFFALYGDRHDAHDHLLDAVRAGARILVVEESKWGRIRLSAQPSAAVLLVADTRKALQDTARSWRQSLGNKRRRHYGKRRKNHDTPAD